MQDDESLQQLLQRHVARTTGAECVDALLLWCQLEFSADDEVLGVEGGVAGVAAAAAAGEGGALGVSYSATERSKLVKGLARDVGGPMAKAVEVLAAGGAQVGWRVWAGLGGFVDGAGSGGLRQQ